MLLGVKPLVFLARLLFFFALVYLLWEPFAPIYTHLLGVLTQAAVSFTELLGPAATRHATTVLTRGNGIFFVHRLFPGVEPPGVPADWVQANMVLLIPLMLATPAPNLKVRLGRLAGAIGIALALQVVGLVVTIKTTWASDLGEFSFLYYSAFERTLYQFLDAFFQSFDTQLFPVVIWAGIHFRGLMDLVRDRRGPREPEKSRVRDEAPQRRRRKKGERRRRAAGGGV